MTIFIANVFSNSVFFTFSFAILLINKNRVSFNRILSPWNYRKNYTYIIPRRNKFYSEANIVDMRSCPTQNYKYMINLFYVDSLLLQLTFHVEKQTTTYAHRTLKIHLSLFFYASIPWFITLNHARIVIERKLLTTYDVVDPLSRK